MRSDGRRIVLLRLAALVVLLGAAGRAASSTIVIGGTNQNNVFPFGTIGYLGEYQQIYASSAFTGPVTITELDFATESGFGSTGKVRDLDLSLGLSTTSATPASPGTNYAANKGSDFTTVFSGTESFTSAGNNSFDLRFQITPFTYNPADGNLLLDVVINSSTGDSVPFVFGSTPDSGRIFNLAGNGAPTAGPSQGLETQFTVAAVPEPSTFALSVLFVFGGGAQVGWRRWRKKPPV